MYELGRLGIAHELVVDAAAAGLIASGEVDAVVVGCDRVAANGDVANKVGTYAHALAAGAAGIPFVVAGPCSTIDPHCRPGFRSRSSSATPTRFGAFRRAPAAPATPAARTRSRFPARDAATRPSTLRPRP